MASLEEVMLQKAASWPGIETLSGVQVSHAGMHAFLRMDVIKTPERVRARPLNSSRVPCRTS